MIPEPPRQRAAPGRDSPEQDKEIHLFETTTDCVQLALTLAGRIY